MRGGGNSKKILILKIEILELSVEGVQECANTLRKFVMYAHIRTHYQGN